MGYIENFDSVNKKINIESIGIKITEDPLILAKNVKKKINIEKKEKKVLEIGAGQGVISILLSEIENIKIFSVEIQEKIYKHLVENIKNNNLENKIYPLNKDIKEVEGEYDIIFSNPP